MILERDFCGEPNVLLCQFFKWELHNSCRRAAKSTVIQADNEQLESQSVFKNEKTWICFALFESNFQKNFVGPLEWGQKRFSTKATTHPSDALFHSRRTICKNLFMGSKASTQKGSFNVEHQSLKSRQGFMSNKLGRLCHGQQVNTDNNNPILGLGCTHRQSIGHGSIHPFWCQRPTCIW